MGAGSFYELVTYSNVFVDKTLLIKKFVESPYTTQLLLFPRRFCKTNNMDMIASFFKKEVDKNGEDILLEKCQNYQVF
jgi:hypothetical protein